MWSLWFEKTPASLAARCTAIKRHAHLWRRGGAGQVGERGDVLPAGVAGRVAVLRVQRDCCNVASAVQVLAQRNVDLQDAVRAAGSSPPLSGDDRRAAYCNGVQAIDADLHASKPLLNKSASRLRKRRVQSGHRDAHHFVKNPQVDNRREASE